MRAPSLNLRLFGKHQRSETLEHLFRDLIFDEPEHLAFFLFDVMLDIFDKDGKLCPEGRRGSGQFSDLRQQLLDLTVLFEALTNYLFQLLIAVFQKMRVKDHLFDMGVHIELFFYHPECFSVVAVLICLDFGK